MAQLRIGSSQAIPVINVGISPIGTLSISSNGVYDVSGYASANVNINTVNNTTLSVTPSKNSQSFTPQSPYTGYGTVTVNAVTAAIDSNIKAENIKSGVSILGVSGSVTELKGYTKTITSNGTYTPGSSDGILNWGKNAYTQVTVNVPNGTQTLSVTPSVSSQSFTPTSPNIGFSSVSVAAVTSSIDSNITAGNIKDGVTILGVTGTYTPQPTLISKTITSNGTYNASDDNVDGYSSITVNVEGEYSMIPSDTYETITLQSSGSTYTAPGDGYFMLDVYQPGSISGAYAGLVEGTGVINNSAVGALEGYTSVFVPIRYGQTKKAYYYGQASNAGSPTYSLKFYYAVGKEPKDLTVYLTGSDTNNLASLTINGVTYTSSNFSSDEMEITIPSNVNVPYSITTTDSVTDSGNLYIGSASTMTIDLTEVEGETAITVNVSLTNSAPEAEADTSRQ